jgi:dienelactone hydrolase
MPAEMAAWFQPPQDFNLAPARSRSPLLFYDGSPVKTAADWPRRREEILQRWQEIMGPWPELLEKPDGLVVEATDRENVIQKKLQLQISPNQTVEAFLLVPKTPGRHPAVFVPCYDVPGTLGLGKASLRDIAWQLSKRGFVTLTLGPPGGNPRTPDTAGAHCQPLSYLAYIGSNCANWLATLPEVDPQRIGIYGHAYGGKWAMFASCLGDRFACAVWSDPGIVFDERKPGPDYWNPWYLGFETTPPRVPQRRGEEEGRTRSGAYKVLIDNHLDLTELHALMAPRPFLVSAGSERRPGWAASSADTEASWSALEQTVAVNRLLGYDQRVAMTNRPGHEPTAQSNEQVYQFLSYFLKP